ncbi:male sterility protein-domain-containing protein [Boeremia exigua]|uniref:male sterility protein-domain-containing protein n=1 Tax=Boeremia exigua TaxID=749465 RepID=UPI001E8EACF8|nr:male sterility protein-domain-containing protein [Boeremia exigua]KAH6612690.1 male sterility protein-domain-containing protein [Boeremia exigua]
MQTNYFVCTLGQAATLNRQPNPYTTIGQFVDYQALHNPYISAVGFPVPRPQQNKWSYKVLTFADVARGVNVLAEKHLQALGRAPEAPETVALLCHSSPEFLFTWLALMRLGYSVLLIAPQCQPAAILHLYKSCQASTLFYDIAHAERAEQTSSLAKEEDAAGFDSRPLLLREGEDIYEVISEAVQTSFKTPTLDETAVAYLHHTSGTSSGLPKPIPQSHRAGLGVLPHLPTTPMKSTFTTTPLYHGGIADLFRAWTSNSLIWLFPGKDVPITARNICSSLEVAESHAAFEGNPGVKYFSSVPYVLQMMESDEHGLTYLQKMDIVGVGGAALPAEVGDRLAKSGVNLISRFGSAECGFIMSSFRDFSADKDWQYLRNYNPEKLLSFESREDGLAELVIKQGWPHMAKQNRSNGSFATADLFAPHPSITDAWIYNSRADSQLTLITGKKFDPAPLEDAIATSPYLGDVLIFGTNRPYPGALLLRSEKGGTMTDPELLDVLKPVVEKLNRDSQDHARIPHDMLVPLPYQEPLEKSSKGTLIRRAAEARFENTINRAYEERDSPQSTDVSDEDLPQHLKGLIQTITSQSAELTDDMDLFSYGVDSIACMQLRSRLRGLIPDCDKPLPMSVIEDCGSIQRLTNYVLQKRHGESGVFEEDEEQLMLDLVKQYGSFEDSPLQPATNGQLGSSRSRDVVVLTGATGALGAHILDLLQRSESVETVYCLVRGADEDEAKKRVNMALEQRGLMNLLVSDRTDAKVKVIPAQLGDERLGLSDLLYDQLAERATCIIHVAWTVNFRLKLRSFVKDNIAGVRNLLNLALSAQRSSPPRFAYCSSTAAVMNSEVDQSGGWPEKLLHDPSSASPLGYSRSKWVAEHICAEADSRTSLRGRIAVVRVGQLAGDSKSGVWNTKEAWPMMLSTASIIKCLPDLSDEVLDWLPVDVAAQAFLESTRKENCNQTEIPVYHVLNPHRQPTWHDMLLWLKQKADFEIVSPQNWLQRLEESNTEHSAKKLLGLWKEAYGDGSQDTSSRRPYFAMEKSKECIPVLRGIKPLDEAYLQRVWEWVQANVR